MTAKAAWFDTGYSYRQRIPITNSGTALTDYQVGITINTSSLISASKMQSDCDDMRFTTENGEDLDYWIEENNPGCNNSATRVWVKLPSVPVASVNIYFYYGNPTMTGRSDGSSTFAFFDDFNGTALNPGRWSNSGGSYTFTGTELHVDTGALYTTFPIVATAQNYIYESRIKWRNTTGNYGGMQISEVINPQGSNAGAHALVYMMGNTTTNHQIIAYGSTGSATGYGITSGTLQFTATADTYTVAGYSLDSTNLRFYNNRSQTNSYTGTFTEAPYMSLGTFTGSAAGATDHKDMSVDWVLVRKYAATVPTIGTFASEENAPGPAAYWKLDEEGGNSIYDSTENANSGTLGSGISAPIRLPEDQCIQGTCLLFDGTDDAVTMASVKPEIRFLHSSSFSISAWVKPTKYEGYRSVVAGQRNTSIFFGLINGTVGLGLDDGFMTSNNVVPLNRWTHIAVVYSSNSATLYINGYADNTVANVDVASTAYTTLFIGHESRFAETFMGTIDEVRIFSYARSSDQIKTEFIQGASASGSSAVLGMQDQSYLSNGLVSHWKMDESSWGTPLDSSGNNYNGTIAGNAGITAPGKFGNGGTFDGNGDYITVGSEPALNPDLMTVAVWIKPNSGYTSTYRVFASRGTGDASTNRDWQFRTRTGDGVPQFYLYNSAGSQITATGSTPVPTGSWTHLVGIYDGSSVKIYTNGKLEVSNPGSLTRNMTATGQTTIGRQAGSGFYYWTGQLDDVRIYNRAFTSSEVVQLYEWAPEPVAYWDFNENTSTTANDKSGNGFTGTITGAEWGPGKYGSALRFNGADYVNIASPSFPGIAGHITISAWVNGDAAIQPQNNSIFEGYGVGNTVRSLNAHVPWSNSIVYWDAGPGSALYDRISKTAVPVEFEGDWNHWAFTKDISTGSMKMYLNGTLWHSGVGNTRPIASLTSFRIGSYTDGTLNYDGLIDDFRIYNYERTPKQIVQDMNGSHPGVGSPVGSAQAYWKMDEGYGTTINSTGGNTVPGTITGATWTNDGKYGKALNFNGSGGRVSFTSAAALSTTEGTVSFWINSDQNQANPAYAFSHPQTGDNSRIYFSFDGTSVISGRLGTAVVIGTYPLTNGKWHHVAMTWKGTSAAFYGDGKDLTTTSTFNGLTSLAASSFIGCLSGASQCFDGKMDEVKIYNYSLTADEIKVEYNQGKAIALGSASTGVGGTTPNNSTSREYCMPGDTATCNPPVAEYMFNENIGSTAQDTSGNNYMGNFVGSPSWISGKNSSGVSTGNTTSDYVNPSTDIDIGANWTISTWFKYPLTSTGASWHTLTRGSVSDHQIIVQRSNNVLGMYDNATGGNYRSSGFDFDTLSTGWHHLAAVGSGSVQDFYIDGQYVGQTDRKSSTDITAVGNFQSGNQNWGTIDEFRVYDYSRTHAQIIWEYNKGAPLALYKMDECEGSSIYNSAPTFNDAAAGMNGVLTIGGSGTNTTIGTCSTSGSRADGAIGKRNASIELDGVDDCVVIGDSIIGDKLNGSSGASFSLWNNFNSFASNGNFERVINIPINAFSAGLSYVINDDEGQVRVGGRSQAADSVQEQIIDYGHLDEWHHITGVFNFAGDSLQVYIDGVQVANNSASFGSNTFVMGTPSVDDTIGCYDGSSEFSDASYDDVRFYNYPLTPHQVKTIYNNGAVSFE